MGPQHTCTLHARIRQGESMHSCVYSVMTILPEGSISDCSLTALFPKLSAPASKSIHYGTEGQLRQLASFESQAHARCSPTWLLRLSRVPVATSMLLSFTL